MFFLLLWTLLPLSWSVSHAWARGPLLYFTQSTGSNPCMEGSVAVTWILCYLTRKAQIMTYTVCMVYSVSWLLLTRLIYSGGTNKVGKKVLEVSLMLHSCLLYPLTLLYPKSIYFRTKNIIVTQGDASGASGDPAGNRVITQSGSEILYSWSHGNASSGAKWSLVHHSPVYPSNDLRIRQERSGLGQLGQQCVGGGAQVLKQVLEASEMSDDLRRDPQRPAQSPQRLLVVHRVEEQGQVLDWVIVERLNTVTWTESE